MDYQSFLVRLPGYPRPTRGISRLLKLDEQGLSISTLSPINPVAEIHSYNGLSDIKCSASDPMEFTFKTLDSTHTFVCNSRDRLLSTLHNRLDDLNSIGTDFLVKKYSNHRGDYHDVILRLRHTSIVKLTSMSDTMANAKKLNLIDVLKIQTAGDMEEMMLIHTKSRVWQIMVDQGEVQHFASAVQQNAKTYLEKHIPVERITREEVVLMTNARTESLRSSTVLFEYSVVKNNNISSGMQRERTIAITEEFMAEVAGKQVVALHSLSDILGLVVSDTNELEVVVEFRDWHPTHYYVSDREAFVGSLADTIQNIARNGQFSIRLEPLMQYTLPDKPLPLFQNEYEIYLISRFMSVVMNSKEGREQMLLQQGKDVSQAPKDGKLHRPLCAPESVEQWFPILKEYVCNMQPGDSLCIDGRPMFAIGQILKASLEMKPEESASYAVTCCAVIQRLLGSRAVFESVKSNQDFVLTMNKAIRHPTAIMAYAAACTFCAAVRVRQVTDGAEQTATERAVSFLRSTWTYSAEAANKHAVLTADNIQVLVARLQTDALLQQNALQVQGILEILTLALNLPAVSDAEVEKQWLQAFEGCLLVASDVLAALTRSPSSILLCSNLLLLQVIFKRCTPGFIEKFQGVILSRAVVLLLLKNALFNKLQRARRLSTELLHTIAARSPEIQHMLARILPKGFFWILKQRMKDEASPELDIVKVLTRPGSTVNKEAAGNPLSGSNSGEKEQGDQQGSSGPSQGSSSSASASATAQAAPSSTTAGGNGAGTAAVSAPRSTQTLSQTLASAVVNAASMALPGAGVSAVSSFPSLATWQEVLDLLRLETVASPNLLWNEKKRHELHKFLREQVEALDNALGRTGTKDVQFNSADVQCIFSLESDDNEVCRTIINDVHVEHLLRDSSSVSLSNKDLVNALWRLEDPPALFQAVATSLLVCFTPLYGTSDLPEIEPRLAVDVLTWMFERHATEVEGLVNSLRLVEMFVAMLREAVDNGHSVFAFKSMLFLQTLLAHGGRQWINRFVRAGGISVIVPLMTSSLAKCCKDPSIFECDAPSLKDGQGGFIETVPVVGFDGEVRMARVPCSKLAADKAGGANTAPIGRRNSYSDGTMEARDAIKWQDDSVPEKVQLGMALELLENLLGSVEHSSTAELFPAPFAWEALARTENLYCLLQMLLRAKAPVFRRVLDLAVTLTQMDKQGMASLYKYGVFEMLLWKLLAGDLWEEDKLRVASFLRKTHLQQDSQALEQAPMKGIVVVDHLPWHNSVLRLYLPAGLVSKLIQEGSDVFLSHLKADDLDTAEVIWNGTMKERLIDHLATDLEPYVQSRSTDALATYTYAAKAPLVYPELAGTIFVAPVYLHNVLDMERFPSHQMFDSTSFHQSILKEYSRVLHSTTPGAPSGTTWRHEAPRLALLLKAQATIMERFAEIPIVAEAESVVIDIATPALRMCIAQREECPAQMTDILGHATRILCSIAKNRETDAEVSIVSVNFALSILTCGTRIKADMSFPDSCAGSALGPALIGSMGILEQTASTREGRRVLRDDVRWRKGFWWSLCTAAGDAAGRPGKGEAPKHSPIVFPALDCLRHFAGDSELCYRIIKQGLVLPLLLLAVPASSSALGSHVRPSVGSIANGDADTSLAVEALAGEVLRTLAVTLEQAPESEAGPQVLATVIPYSILAELKSSEDGVAKFLALVSDDNVRLPMAIWTADVRAELRRKVTERLKKVSAVHQGGAAGKNDDEVGWLNSFRYDSLKDEMLICGVFVKGYAEGSWEQFDLPDGRAFMATLQQYLAENSSNLDPGAKGKKGSKPGKENAEGDSAPEETKGKSPAVLQAEFLSGLKALSVCVRCASEEGNRSILAALDYKLLAHVLDAAGTAGVTEAQGHVVDVVRHLAGAPNCREQLLSSPLLRVLAEQLWRQLSKKPVPGGKAGGEGGKTELAVKILDALLAVTVEMAAVIAITNLFCSSGMLLVLLFLLMRLPLPSLPDHSPADNSAAQGNAGGTPSKIGHSSSGSYRVDEELQLKAAQILGQILLAACGVQRRAHPGASESERAMRGKQPSAKRSRTAPLMESVSDGMDVHQLVGLLDDESNLSVVPIAVRHMYLLLPIHLMKLLMERPAEACTVLSQETCDPQLVWNDGAAKRTRVKLRAEAAAMVRRWKSQWEDQEVGAAGSCAGAQLGLPEWSLEIPGERPVFLRYVLEEVQDPDQAGPKKELFADDEKDGYAAELCLAGWYVDQLLRHPEFELGETGEQNLVRELRKLVVMAAPTEGRRSADFSRKDRRRLLLCLLVLFRAHPKLLTLSNTTDVFLPVLDMVGGATSKGEERRELVQPALLLLYTMVTSTDVADFLAGDELLTLLSELLILDVPPKYAGREGSDPRVCALMVMLRLFRGSSQAINKALERDIVSRLVSLFLDVENALKVRTLAARVLHGMKGDKRVGHRVRALVDEMIPPNFLKHTAWVNGTEKGSEDDAMEDADTMHYLLSHKRPCADWWTADTPEGTLQPSGSRDEEGGPTSVVEASLHFPKAKFEHFSEELEGALRFSLASAAGIPVRDGRIVRKRPALGMVVEIEVQFKSGPGRQCGPVDVAAKAFKAWLESNAELMLSNPFAENLGKASLRGSRIQSWGYSR